MNPDTGMIYASLDEATKAGENPDDIVWIEGREEKVAKIISNLQEVDKARIEKRRQIEKNRRNAAQASRKKNRRKK